MIDLMMA